ncbi:hypothetical protein H4S08_002067 [Coemansia sp. RSA 1365]|nr:hypothetical protein H4S08_002067 [Coemansia sp. RSA 1365]
MLYSDNAKTGADATAPTEVTPALADGTQQRLGDGTQQPLYQQGENHPEINGLSSMCTTAGNDTRVGGSSAGADNQHPQLNMKYHRGGNADEGVGVHGRTRSDGTGIMREQSPPAFSPKNRSNTNIMESLGTLQRCGSVPDDRSPPMIRQVHSEIGQNTRRGKHGGSSSSNSSCSSVLEAGITAAQQEDSSKNGYALWMPWEEDALATWLYEPENCKLFNVPRRKKECHERIIREILPRKTSRAIEGKIRTMEKRYLRAAAEIRLPNFETKHQGKSREEVAESMCNYFKKLDIVFNPLQAQAHSHVPPTQKHQQQQQRVWNAIGSSATQSIAPVPALPAASISIPRSTSPPRISVADSMPMTYHVNTHGRKIAPKRGAEGGEGGDDDLPVMMSSSKRSRTLPAILQNRQSPGNVHHHHHHQKTQLSNQQVQLLRQHQQLQQPHYEGGIRQHAYDAGGRPSTVTLPMIPMASPGPSAGADPNKHSVAPPTANTQQRHNHQLAATSGVRDTHDTGCASMTGAVQGTREELDWLQLNLRREELEFRKHVFAKEQELENKRMLLEERRLENQRRETDIERERLGTRRQEVDMQLETLRLLTTLLGRIVGHGESTVGMPGVPAQQPLSRIDQDRQSPVAPLAEPHPDSF